MAAAAGDTHKGTFMPLGIGNEPSEEEAAALERLREQDTANGDNEPLGDEPGPGDTVTPEGEPAPTPAVAPAPEAATVPAPAEAPAAPAAPAAQDKHQPGDPARGALRAARAGERRAVAERDRLREENEALRKKLETVPKAPDPHAITDEEIESAAADFPLIGKIARAVRNAPPAAAPVAAPAAAPAAPVAAPPSHPEFVPLELPPDLQDAVDNVPELLAMQHDPDQSRFKLAQAIDGMLDNHPKWKGKPLEERFAEVVRRVNAEFGAAPAAPAPAPAKPKDPQAAIDNAPVRTPKAASEIGGGSGADQGNDLARFAQMSEDDVMNELIARGG